MLFFNRSISLKDSPIFSGYTDWHSHILPGVDDGVETMDEALQILVQYERMGIRQLCLTPHIMEDIPNSTGMLKERFAELVEAYSKTSASPSISLSLAAENMMDALFLERLEQDDLLTLPGMKNTLLVETSYYNPPILFHDTLQRIKSKGYHIVLAHPERYLYMSEREYGQLREMNVSFQLNLMSLLGTYGKDVRRKALDLLSKGWYQLTGSDLHSAQQLNRLWEGELSKNEVAMLQTIL